MENLDVKFADEINKIMLVFDLNKNIYQLKKSVLKLINDSIFQEYFEYINLSYVEVYTGLESLNYNFNIVIYFKGERVVNIQHPNSITRILFDNPSYLVFNRKKLLEYINS